MSRLAQLVERKTLNLVVVGSSPTVGGRRRRRRGVCLTPLARAPFCRTSVRGIGAIGSVRASQARGTGIETQILQNDFFFFFFSFVCVAFFFLEKKKKKICERPYSTQDSRMVPHCSTD